ncbi:MAG: tyrosine-type recombinase/integrase [Solirubrobacteraceae bacterium]
MKTLHESMEDYLRIRRHMGYKLDRAEHLLSDYLRYLDARDERLITIENAVAWATLPADCEIAWWAFRLSQVRCFARYLHALDPAHQVPPADLLPRRSRRSTPYLYSEMEIAALLDATGTLKLPLQRATYRTLIALLSVTGMRVGEARRLDRGDLDLRHGALTVRNSKFNKSRLLPLHPSTVSAMRGYLRQRDQHPRAGNTDAVFMSTRGTRLDHSDVNRTFRKLLKHAELGSHSASCRPRPHDLRHSYAVRTLLDWYRADLDVPARLPLLSTYLGHVQPSDTYWYLQAAPELLGLAAGRLERSLGERS